MKKVFYESWIAKYLLGCTSIKRGKYSLTELVQR